MEPKKRSIRRKRKSKKGKIIIKLFIIAFILIVCHEIFENFLSSITNNIEENIDNSSVQNIVINEDKNEEKADEQKVIVEDSHIKLNVIGDIMCHNTQYMDAYNAASQTYDFSYVFDDVKEATSKSDVFIGNLETTFAGKERGYSNYPNFNTPEQLAYDLKGMGIDILTTANNHCMDTGYTGLERTLDFLDDAQIEHTGTNRSKEEQNTILVKEINGIKIAFLSFTYGTNGIGISSDKDYAVNLIGEDLILSQIKLAQKESPDLICASIHWGIEYQNIQNDEQEKWADFLISNGVNIILGSHPHVLQPMEIREVKLENGEIRKGFVIYSMGNFMSGQTQKNTHTSIILNLDITKNGKNSEIFVDNVSYIPIYTYKGTGNKKYKVLNIEKAVEKYESGEDKSIGESNYNLFKEEINRINEMMTIKNS